VTESELDQIEARAAAAGPAAGLRATRDDGPAGAALASFIAHAREDVLRLVAAVRRSERLPDAELDAIAARAGAAGPAPFDVFLEADGGMAGCNLIWVGGADHDEEPDLYLWRGDDLAPDADWVFIAYAREDVPRLVEAARTR
jgi:hypothetical protein